MFCSFSILKRIFSFQPKLLEYSNPKTGIEMSRIHYYYKYKNIIENIVLFVDLSFLFPALMWLEIKINPNKLPLSFLTRFIINKIGNISIKKTSYKSKTKIFRLNGYIEHYKNNVLHQDSRGSHDKRFLAPAIRLRSCVEQYYPDNNFNREWFLYGKNVGHMEYDDYLKIKVNSNITNF